MSTHRDYTATVVRDGDKWAVRVRDPKAGTAGFCTHHLAEVELRTRELITGWAGEEPADVTLDVRLPSATQLRLDLVRELCNDVDEEITLAMVELIEAGWSIEDIAWVVGPQWVRP